MSWYANSKDEEKKPHAMIVLFLQMYRFLYQEPTDVTTLHSEHYETMLRRLMTFSNAYVDSVRALSGTRERIIPSTHNEREREREEGERTLSSMQLGFYF